MTDRRIVMALIAIATALLAIGLRRTTSFATTVELPVYDFLTTKTWPWKSRAHPMIVLVTMSDENFWRGLNDENLANLITRLKSGAPTVVAVDLIRDNALPPGSGELKDAVVNRSPGETVVLMAAGIPGLGGKENFMPPSFLRDPDLRDAHVGFTVMPEDSPGRPMVRRGLVAVHGGEWLSMPAQAAVNHLTFHDPARLEKLFEQLSSIASLHPTAGGYAGNNGGGNQFLLKSGTNLNERYPVIAAESIAAMDEQSLKNHFAGKIIFIGTEPNLSQDEKPVAGNSSVRGIKLLALATDQLLRELDSSEKPIGWIRDWVEDSSVIAAATLAVTACAALGGPLLLRILTIIPILSAAWLVAGGWLLQRGIWVPVGAPVFVTLLSGTAAHSLMYLSEQKDRLRSFSLLEKHLSPEVAGAIWEHNEALLKDLGPAPETIHATALFADLKGYSGITDRFEKNSRSQQFIDWLNTYLQAVIPVVRNESGFVQQFAGDGIFVIFGFPVSKNGEHPLHAVRCARQIAEIVAGLNHSLDPGMPPYHARIGIYTGDIICATVGDRSHASYSFFGSTINKAARLESLHKERHAVDVEPVRILISEPTRHALDASCQVVPFSEEPVALDPNLPPERVWKIL